MKGTIQIIVNLRSPSVEYSREEGAGRFSTVLKSDCQIADDFRDAPDAFDGESDEEKVIRCVKSIHEMARYVGNLDFFMITRGGKKCYIHPGDISYITINATDELRKIEE